MKNLRMVKLVTIILLNFLLVDHLIAQNTTQVEVRDFETWMSAELRYKPNKKWVFGLEEQLRLKENASVTDSYFTQLSIKNNIYQGFGIGAAYRFIRNNDNKGNVQGYENFNRIQFDLLYKHKPQNFILKYRLRYQTKNELGVSENEGDFANQNFRFKTAVGYNIKKWQYDPELSFEIFNRRQKNSDNGFNKVRATIGTNIDLNKFGEIDVFYRFEKQLNVTTPKTTNIVGLNYAYIIEPRKKSKKKKYKKQMVEEDTTKKNIEEINNIELREEEI